MILLPECLLLLTSGAGYDRNEGPGNDMNCMQYFIKKNDRRQGHRRTKLSTRNSIRGLVFTNPDTFKTSRSSFGVTLAFCF